MEIGFPVSREQLRRYAAIRAQRERNAYITEGANFITTSILDSAAPPSGSVYTFKFGVEPVITCCEIVVASIVAACSKKHPSVYEPVRDGPFTPMLEQMMAIVRERFPDCVFTQDPAKKYLFVDWS